MYKDKFQMVLSKDEEIKWCNKSNATACTLKVLIPTILLGIFFSFFIAMFLGGILNLHSSDGPNFTMAFYILPVIIISSVLYTFLNAKNTYFCITNKRIIRRSGAFNNDFIHYTLKNIGTVEVNGSIADSNGSANLLITTKDFHTDNKGNTHANRFKISSLYNAYEAYNVLSELAEGNNESLRVKIEK